MILDHVISDGLSPRQKTRNEFSSPCPVCGGSDRFLIWPESNRYWCRQCNTKGDEIQYLMEFHGMDFCEAAEQTGTTVNVQQQKPYHDKSVKGGLENIQLEEWRKKASSIIEVAHNELIKSPDRLDWLKQERGLSDKSVKQFRLGWLNENLYLNKNHFGLPAESKKLFIPSGLLIPWHHVRIRIRRNKPGNYNKYHVVSGSNTSDLLTIGEAYENTAVIVESELDAILLSQEIDREIFIIALGSASMKPNRSLCEALNLSNVILIALDTDDAGASSSQWWLTHFTNSYRTLTPKKFGKDITESFLNGLDLNKWLSASLELCAEDICDNKDIVFSENRETVH